LERESRTTTGAGLTMERGFAFNRSGDHTKQRKKRFEQE
jgi:hypothetical protein